MARPLFVTFTTEHDTVLLNLSLVETARTYRGADGQPAGIYVTLAGGRTDRIPGLDLHTFTARVADAIAAGW